MTRLDKFLADAGIGTRSEVKKFLKAGKVQVNNEVITKPEYKIDEKKDSILFEGNAIAYEKYGYYVLHKPKNCVTATRDKQYKTVMDYMPKELLKDYAPVGRLDIDTEGLLLITNDGELTHHLISPSHHVPKTYYAEVEGSLNESMIQTFKDGVLLDGQLTQEAFLEILSEHTAKLTIYEGKFHQVKRMFHSVGCEVTYLKRLSMGNLTLKDLPLGEFRKLTNEEIDELKRS